MPNNFNNVSKNPRILVCPLDWGLGHATRCIPIIKQLIQLNCEVIIAADDLIYSLLKEEFPSTVFLRKTGYQMYYSRKKRGLPLTLFFQIPKLFYRIWSEHLWLKKIEKEYNLDAVISDNRFGIFSDNIASIYITHQLSIRTGNNLLNKMVNDFHHYFIKKYSKCWVPDQEIEGLGGSLSHPEIIPENVDYIGPLSRFDKIENCKIKYDILVSLSGPEPQRTIFETTLLAELNSYRGTVLVARGLPFCESNISSANPLINIVNHLNAIELNNAICQSQIIICRSGYTTLMDLVKLGKKAILVPTPGQKEQEYLAQYLSYKKYFYACDQNNFSLTGALNDYSQFKFNEINIFNEKFTTTVNEFVHSLKTGNFASQ